MKLLLLSLALFGPTLVEGRSVVEKREAVVHDHIILGCADCHYNKVTNEWQRCSRGTPLHSEGLCVSDPQCQYENCGEHPEASAEGTRHPAADTKYPRFPLGCQFNFDSGLWEKCTSSLWGLRICQPDFACDPNRAGGPCICDKHDKCQRCMFTQDGLTDCHDDYTCYPTPPKNVYYQLAGGHCECKRGHCQKCPDALPPGSDESCTKVHDCDDYRKGAIGPSKVPASSFTPTHHGSWVGSYCKFNIKTFEFERCPSGILKPSDGCKPDPTCKSFPSPPRIPHNEKHPQWNLAEARCEQNILGHWKRCMKKTGPFSYYDRCRPDPTCEFENRDSHPETSAEGTRDPAADTPFIPASSFRPADFHKKWPGGSCECVNGACQTCTEGLPPQYGRPCQKVPNCDKYRFENGVVEKRETDEEEEETIEIN